MVVHAHDAFVSDLEDDDVDPVFLQERNSIVTWGKELVGDGWGFHADNGVQAGGADTRPGARISAAEMLSLRPKDRESLDGSPFGFGR